MTAEKVGLTAGGGRREVGGQRAEVRGQRFMHIFQWIKKEHRLRQINADLRRLRQMRR
jgi:hypothetical protein